VRYFNPHLEMLRTKKAMSNYLDQLLKHHAGATGAPSDVPVDQKIRDADGKQLAQSTNVAPNELTEWNDLPRQPNMDLDLASTERRRVARSRTNRKR
jgi:hypothetical protein